MDDPDHDPLERLADEFAERLRRGETPTVAEYAEAHPELADEIRDVFPSIQMMEQLALRRQQQRTANQSPPGAAVSDPERLGDYRILRRIGQGGMGIVYEAIHESLGRHVAVKVLLPQLAVSEQHVARFVREAQAAARLHHTNIVPVFGVGQDQGYHYYVMQLIAGQGLDLAVARKKIGSETGPHTRCARVSDPAPVPSDQSPETRETCGRSFRRGRETFAERGTFADRGPRYGHSDNEWLAVARIGVQAAEALAYAHAQGTLHRDIKPANLLLDSQGVVWVADFGLAKVLDDVSLSHSGSILGTLRYMAPEQLHGQAEARSDIYSLGLTLYELLAGRPAFEETVPSSLIQKITQGEAMPLRQVQPGVPRDLETIVAKAAAREAGHRYASASELADDLRRFVNDLPIHARRVTAAERVWRWSRRNPLLAALSASSIVLLLAITLLSSLGYVQVRHAYDQADQALGQARRSEANAVAAARQAEQERQRTQREYERADANLAVALAALDEISDRLASRPLPESVRLGSDDASGQQTLSGLSDVDAETVQSLLRFYDQFASQNAAGASVDFATARVQRRIGDIRARLGHYDQAVSAYQQAWSAAGKLRNTRPADVDLLRFEVQTGNACGAALLKSGDFQRAIEMHRQAQELLAAQASPLADRPELRYEQALTLQALVQARSAALLDQQNRRGPRRPGQDSPPVVPPEIEQEFQRAIQVLDNLLQAAPEDADYLLALARCHRSILPAAWANGDRAKATAAKQQAIAVLQKLAERKPDDLTIQFEWADTLAMTGQADSRTPLPESDVADLQQALKLATGLHEKCPTAPEYALLQANVQQKLGMHCLAAKQWSEAQGQLTNAASVLERLVATSPNNLLFQTSLARVRWELADSLRRQGSLAPARGLLEKAIAEYDAFRGTEAGRRASAGLLAGLYRELARVLEQLGEKQLALGASETADRLRDRPNEH